MSVTGTGTITREEVDRGVRSFLEHAAVDDYESGWFCVATDSYPCPASGCDFVAGYMTAAHLVVVWPRNDDPELLAAASNARLAGRNPRILEYELGFGPCIAFDLWVKIGRPVHGVGARPDGYDAGKRARL